MERVTGNLTEMKEVFTEIMQYPEKVFELLELDMKAIAERSLCELLKIELTSFLGRQRYERQEEKKANNYRNGFSDKKFTVKKIGELNLKVPRDRAGKYKSTIIKKYERYDKRLEKDISLMFLSGLSTRGIGLISQSLIGRKISPAEVSKVNKELLSGIDAWRERALHDYKIKYLYIDGVNFHMRVNRKIEIIPMLVVIGVLENNRKMFLAIQQGDKESASTWREIFKDMKTRGLNKNKIQLGVMDGLPGLMKVFVEEFPNAKVQRCQVHVARNVLSKVSRGMKKEVADSLRNIFYASSRKKAKEHFRAFDDKYQETCASAVKCLSNVIDECLTFYSFPDEEWISLRTTNVIERVNKEFKRRTKPMEILAGERAAYRLLCFVALKMELTWKSVPLGRNNLPGLLKFTQTT